MSSSSENDADFNFETVPPTLPPRRRGKQGDVFQDTIAAPPLPLRLSRKKNHKDVTCALPIPPKSPEVSPYPLAEEMPQESGNKSKTRAGYEALKLDQEGNPIPENQESLDENIVHHTSNRKRGDGKENVIIIGPFQHMPTAVVPPNQIMTPNEHPEPHIQVNQLSSAQSIEQSYVQPIPAPPARLIPISSALPILASSAKSAHMSSAQPARSETVHRQGLLPPHTLTLSSNLNHMPTTITLPVGFSPTFTGVEDETSHKHSDNIPSSPAALHEPLSTLSVERLQECLEKIGLCDKADIFAKRCVDGELFMTMPDQMLSAGPFYLNQFEILQIKRLRDQGKFPKHDYSP